MSFISRLLGRFGPVTLRSITGCSHAPEKGPFSIVVQGVDCRFESSDACAACLADYLEQHSALCAHCQRPIYPGEPVAKSWMIGALQPYTHYTSECGEAIMLLGTWGEGKVVPFHEEQEGGSIVLTPPPAYEVFARAA